MSARTSSGVKSATMDKISTMPETRTANTTLFLISANLQTTRYISNMSRRFHVVSKVVIVKKNQINLSSFILFFTFLGKSCVFDWQWTYWTCCMYSWDSIFMQFPYFRSKGWQCFKFTCLRECNVTPVITSKSIFYSKVLAVGGLLVAQLYDIFHCYFHTQILECTRVGGGGLLENVWIFIFSQWVCNLSSWERVKKSWERAHWQRSPSNCLLSAKAGDKDVAKFEEGDIKQWEAKTLHDFQLFANWWQSCLEVLVHLMVGGKSKRTRWGKSNRELLILHF